MPGVAASRNQPWTRQLLGLGLSHGVEVNAGALAAALPSTASLAHGSPQEMRRITVLYGIALDGIAMQGICAEMAKFRRQSFAAGSQGRLLIVLGPVLVTPWQLPGLGRRGGPTRSRTQPDPLGAWRPGVAICWCSGIRWTPAPPRIASQRR